MARIAGDSAGPQMPPTGALKPEQIGLIKAWMDQGAEWPDEFANEAPPVALEPRAARLMDAALWGNATAVRRAPRSRRRPQHAQRRGATPLMRAVTDLEKTRVLLEHRADVNARSDDGRSRC